MRFFLLDHFSRHPWGCVEALKPFLGPFFPRKLLINMLVTLIGENSASESVPNTIKIQSQKSKVGNFNLPAMYWNVLTRLFTPSVTVNCLSKHSLPSTWPHAEYSLGWSRVGRG